MPSPFPGMDPYLEAPSLWPGVHQSLITYIRDDLQQNIRPNYHARIGERLYVLETSRDIYPDVALVQRPTRQPTATGMIEAPIVADKPFTVTISPTEYREPYIEIVHTAGGKIITVIEILSPANKIVGRGQEMYRQKQQEILDSPTHLVEIDLLSQGLSTIALPENSRANLPSHRYLVSVSRGPEHRQLELYPVTLFQRLPRFRIPLMEPDPDVVLDLPIIFNRCYDNGGYADFVDYSQPPSVPLSKDEHKWLATNIKYET